MRIFPLLFLMAFVFASALSAQSTQARNGSSTRTQTTPAPAPKSAKITPSTSDNSRTSDRSGDAAKRPSTPTVFGNPQSRQNNTTERNTTRPAATTTRANTGLRPSYAPPSSTNLTTKGAGSTGNAKAVPLKPAARGKVNWMTLEQALEKSKTEKRKIFLDMYTDWCGWCKHMDSTTFVDPAVARYLNEHFYPVKFNAEQEQDILFKDKTYHFKKNGTRGYHELAAFWLNNRLSFPTIVFLDENQNLIQPVPGYQDASKMEAIINYFGSDSHKKTPWETYEKTFLNKK